MVRTSDEDRERDTHTETERERHTEKGGKKREGRREGRGHESKGRGMKLLCFQGSKEENVLLTRRRI